MQDRPTLNEYYLKIAEAVSLRAPCLKKHYGAIIVKDNQILSTGYNGPVRGEPHCKTCTKVSNAKDESAYSSCSSCHAEMNCLLNVARQDMIGATLYLYGFDVEAQAEVTAEPCEICLRLIKNAGIAKVINNSGILYTRDSDDILRKCTN